MVLLTMIGVGANLVVALARVGLEARMHHAAFAARCRVDLDLESLLQHPAGRRSLERHLRRDGRVPDLLSAK